MTYEEQERTEEDFFNVKFYGTREQRSQWLREITSLPEFRDYEIARSVISQGSFLMHEPGMGHALIQSAEKVADLWLAIHSKAFELSKEPEKRW